MKLPKSFTTVTIFSKIIALIIFISLPIAGFAFGVWYKTISNIPVAIVTSPAKPALVKDNPELLYQEAVNDAETALRGEIYKKLTAITADNTNLIRNDSGQVLVTTWTTYQGYSDYIGKDMPMAREVWVTVTPELENFCQDLGLNQEDTIFRFEQVLGIPSKSGKTLFVKMWVSPADLFRPCPDPEINDSECKLEYPQSAYGTINEDYKTWFERQQSISYGKGGYPWTRLGYTYDWGEVTGEIGLSEFVIKSGAIVEIEDVSSTQMSIASYCGDAAK